MVDVHAPYEFIPIYSNDWFGLLLSSLAMHELSKLKQ